MNRNKPANKTQQFRFEFPRQRAFDKIQDAIGTLILISVSGSRGGQDIPKLILTQRSLGISALKTGFIYSYSILFCYSDQHSMRSSALLIKISRLQWRMICETFQEISTRRMRNCDPLYARSGKEQARSFSIKSYHLPVVSNIMTHPLFIHDIKTALVADPGGSLSGHGPHIRFVNGVFPPSDDT